MAYLLDTDICVYVMKKIPSVKQRFDSYDHHELFVSTITIAELEYGIVKSTQVEKNSKSLEGLLTMVSIVNFQVNAASEYGYIRLLLERKGTPIGSNDMLIASIAKSLDFTLITNNESEFKRIEGLKIENWLKN